MATISVASSQPTVAVDGVGLPTLSKQITSLTVEQTVDGLATASVTIDNRHPGGRGDETLFADRSVVDFGARLQIDLGIGREAVRLFDGRVTGLGSSVTADSPPGWTILARDHAEPMRHGSTTGFAHQQSDIDIVEQLVADHGLELDVAIDQSPVEREIVAWTERSDHARLTGRAGGSALDVTMSETTVRITERRAAGGETPVLKFGANLVDFEVTADLAEQVSEVSVRGWDPDLKSRVVVSSGPTALAGELDGAEPGATILIDAFGDRPEHIEAGHLRDSALAQSHADAEMRRRGRRFVRGEGLTTGSPDLRAGARVEILGVGSTFSGIYHLTTVRHRFDGARGFRTEVEAERPGVGQ